MINKKITDRKFIFFAGKGGAGKTTCSASFALNLAKKGIKTLLVSTDPAHSLSHIFESKIGSKEIKIVENLWAIEIDPQKEAKKYMKRIKDTVGKVVSSVIVEEIKRQIDAAYLSPGAEETAIFDKFIELMEKINNPYAKIVFDTAPTGHTLRLLTLPELLGAWIDGLIKKRLQIMNLMKMTSKVDESLRERVKHDPLIEILNKRKEKFILARNYLLDKKSSCFIFVLDAERLSILETVNAISLLRKYKILVDGIIVNRILPKTNDKFLSKRKAVQDKCLREIKSKFKGLIVGYIPLLESDIQGKEVLEKISQVFGDLE
ncbi:MAG: ArsA family ATPase [Candidatus Aminicenantia bacterium]